ncbi:ABC transporter ATP-binding protein [Pseudomonas sp. AP19]|uniref:ABC transporter ATP-binding protein n=1 Tax=Pseudomonas TaxID=286 RepID=UPI00084AA0B1|nr:ABC transporter ATP-binding protein [Pseudomonas sp. AP19]OEC62151.1 ABC transporter ATP-binding protein [Pseudomonas sp. AP19]
MSSEYSGKNAFDSEVALLKRCSDGDVAIRVSNLSKCFQIYSKPSDRLLQMLSRGYKRFYREFWALKNVSFEIRKGETVGIVGRNGSGKSTLLQVICGTLNPTGGECVVNGSIAALLELGAGFNPEFTGRENVYSYAAILGLTEEQINARYTEIEAFAEIGAFIDQPVKTYSSGMFVRLAFAVSVAREPDILIVDEALAVGDDAFRRKCFARIETLRANGTTILFVSHAAAMVVELCDRALLLDNGELLFDGSPKETTALYNKLLFAPEVRRAHVREEVIRAMQVSGANPDISMTAIGHSVVAPNIKTESAHYIEGMVSQTRMEYEQHGAIIIDPHIETIEGVRVNSLVAMQEYQYCYAVRFLENAYNIQFGMLIKTVSGLEIGGANYPAVNRFLPAAKSGQTYEIRFGFRALMNPGTYFFNAGLQGETSVTSERIYLHRILDAVMFRVQAYEGCMTNALVNFDIASMATISEE